MCLFISAIVVGALLGYLIDAYLSDKSAGERNTKEGGASTNCPATCSSATQPTDQRESGGASVASHKATNPETIDPSEWYKVKSELRSLLLDARTLHLWLSRTAESKMRERIAQCRARMGEIRTGVQSATLAGGALEPHFKKLVEEVKSSRVRRTQWWTPELMQDFGLIESQVEFSVSRPLARVYVLTAAIPLVGGKGEAELRHLHTNYETLLQSMRADRVYSEEVNRKLRIAANELVQRCQRYGRRLLQDLGIGSAMSLEHEAQLLLLIRSSRFQQFKRLAIAMMELGEMRNCARDEAIRFVRNSENRAELLAAESAAARVIDSIGVFGPTYRSLETMQTAVDCRTNLANQIADQRRLLLHQVENCKTCALHFLLFEKDVEL